VCIWPVGAKRTRKRRERRFGTVSKRTKKKRVVEITRQMAHGLLNQAEELLQRSGGGTVLNTAFIERLNGTMRERLASLTRKCRHSAVFPAGSRSGWPYTSVCHNQWTPFLSTNNQ
jgi:IS1 family transposase